MALVLRAGYFSEKDLVMGSQDFRRHQDGIRILRSNVVPAELKLPAMASSFGEIFQDYQPFGVFAIVSSLGGPKKRWRFEDIKRLV